ncbi:MAG: peptidylprolyl isomerase [Acidiphilium sp.]|nr:peptidylprolyl isomerase [Acidiphilium sp.]MDD4935223.1 peptidylprolyl isomerase [Acidiphilium sp.]
MKSLLSYGFLLGLGTAWLAPCSVVQAQNASIAAVVNGSVITNQDVDARARLFALSAGLPSSPDTLDRLKPQITSELIDQALQLQAIEQHKVVVPQAQIAAALARIDKANGLPPGGLEQKLAQAGIPYSTLVGQFRTELGWTEVLKKTLGEDLRPTREDVVAEQRAMQHEIGQTQYHLAEIFIPIERPSDEANAKRFADTVIKQLRNGAAFPVVAAQFSQSQSALTGGDRGWVEPDLLDPAVRAIVQRMPEGAISDPVRVAGGFEIVDLLGTRKFGEEHETMLDIRQAFLPFPTAFQGGQPTAGQLAVLSHASALRGGLHDCNAVAAANAAAGNVRKADPGPVNLATVQPAAFQSLLESLPIGQISQPLVSHNGVALVMVCSRTTSKTGLPGVPEIVNLLIQRRVSLESQQLMDTLHRNAVIQREPAE